ncbi:MAG: hypothetical protein IIA50_04055 [Bacteroidetes bacterium]|nr:hypothetical protein [Bacteroidota bacterium]
MDAEVRLPITVEVELADHHTVSDRLVEDAGLHFIAFVLDDLGERDIHRRILMVRLRASGAAQDYRPTCRAERGRSRGSTSKTRRKVRILRESLVEDLFE